MKPDLKTIVRLAIGGGLIIWAVAERQVAALALLAFLGLAADFVWAWSRKVDQVTKERFAELNDELEAAIVDMQKLQSELTGEIGQAQAYQKGQPGPRGRRLDD